jgi:hypothetical protein
MRQSLFFANSNNLSLPLVYNYIFPINLTYRLTVI